MLTVLIVIENINEAQVCLAQKASFAESHKLTIYVALTQFLLE